MARSSPCPLVKKKGTSGNLLRTLSDILNGRK